MKILIAKPTQEIESWLSGLVLHTAGGQGLQPQKIPIPSSLLCRLGARIHYLYDWIQTCILKFSQAGRTPPNFEVPAILL